MKQRRLLQDGTEVSEIGLGCMSFAHFYGDTDEATSHRTLDRARDLGVTFLDTANVYGNGLSEQILGRYLKGRAAPFRIATKAAIWRDPETGKRSFNNKPDHLRSELEGSLTRLGLERVDLFYIHRRDPDLEIEEVMETLLALKSEGKIGGIGFSEIAPSSLRRAIAVGPVDAVQSEYSLWSRQPELGMIQTCAELGVAFVPFSPVCRGIMGAVPPDVTQFPDTSFIRFQPRFNAPHFARNMEKIKAFQAFAADHGTTAIVLSMAWILSQAPHLIPIPGTRTADHLEELVSASAFPMTPQILAGIDRILPLGWAHGERYTPDQWVGVELYG